MAGAFQLLLPSVSWALGRCAVAMQAVAVTVGIAVAAAAPAGAAEGVRVELNRLEEQAGSCRVYLVLDNATTRAYEGYKLDLVVFGPDGVLARRFAFEAAPLRPNKTTVKLFDLQDLACDRIGSVLVNDIIDCRDAAGPRTDCIDGLAVATKAAATLIK